MSFLKTRTAKEQDCAAMVPLFEQWGHAQTELQVSAVLGLWSSTPLGEILLADDHGTVAGMAAVAASPRFADFGRNATLAGLVVADAYRRRGVGTMLLTAVETTARSWGCVRPNSLRPGPVRRLTTSISRSDSRRPPSGRLATFEHSTNRSRILSLSSADFAWGRSLATTSSVNPAPRRSSRA